MRGLPGGVRGSGEGGGGRLAVRGQAEGGAVLQPGGLEGHVGQLGGRRRLPLSDPHPHIVTERSEGAVTLSWVAPPAQPQLSDPVRLVCGWRQHLKINKRIQHVLIIVLISPLIYVFIINSNAICGNSCLKMSLFQSPIMKDHHIIYSQLEMTFFLALLARPVNKQFIKSPPGPA